MEEHLSKIGDFLKATRERLGLTLREVELKSGVSNAYLCLLESGKRVEPHPNILRKLALAYGESLENLLKVAGYLDTSEAEQEKLEVEELFQRALADPSISFGHRLRGDIDFEAKRVIANLYREKLQRGKQKRKA
jgi:transcriptional regulator with XRE-family HTH domain